MPHTVCHFEIPAKDVEGLKKFYSELFGWKIEKFPGDMEYWMIETGGDGVGGGLMAKQHPQHVPMNYILVESVDEYSEKIKKLGGQIAVGKTAVGDMGWFAVGVDPDGNCIGLFETAEK